LFIKTCIEKHCTRPFEASRQKAVTRSSRSGSGKN